MQYTLSILVENQAGVLSKFRDFSLAEVLTSTHSQQVLLRTRRFPESQSLQTVTSTLLNSLKTAQQAHSRHQGKRLNEGEFISRELVLIKVHCAASKRAEIVKTVEIMQAKIVDVSPSSVTVEYCECASRINTLVDLLKPYGIREIVRTGTVAIDRGTASVSV